MPTIREIYDVLCSFAPLELKMDFDNVGFLAGDSNAEVSKVLVALDITPAVIAEAKDAQLIVSHHPIMFSVKSVTDLNSAGNKILSLLKNGTGAICMHTNLDVVWGGVNDVLAETLGLSELRVLAEECEQGGLGRIGILGESCSMTEFLAQVREKLGCEGLRFYDSGRPVQKVAVGGGSCGDYIEAAAEQGCDTFVTADIKYHQFQQADELGINLIDAGHFATEDVVCEKLVSIIKKAFPTVEVSKSAVHRDIIRYFA